MPHKEQKSENSLSFQQVLEIIGRPQKEESAGAREAPSAKPKEKRPSREVVLKVIEGLKQV